MKAMESGGDFPVGDLVLSACLCVRLKTCVSSSKSKHLDSTVPPRFLYPQSYTREAPLVGPQKTRSEVSLGILGDRYLNLEDSFEK